MIPFILPLMLLSCDLTVVEGSAYVVPAGGDRTVCLDGGEDGIFQATLKNQFSHNVSNTGKITWTFAPGTTAIENLKEQDNPDDAIRTFRHLKNRGPMRIENMQATGDLYVHIVADDGGDSLEVINCDGPWLINVTPNVADDDVFGVYIEDCDFVYPFPVEDPISISCLTYQDNTSDCPYVNWSVAEVYRFNMKRCTFDLQGGLGVEDEAYLMKNYAFSGTMDSVTVYDHQTNPGISSTIFQWFCSNFTLSNSRIEGTGVERMMTIRGHTDDPRCADEEMHYHPADNKILNTVFVANSTVGNGVSLDCDDTEMVGCKVFAPGNYGSTAHVIRVSEEANNTLLSNCLFVGTGEGQVILNQGPGLLTIENCSIYHESASSFQSEWGSFFHTKTFGDSTVIRNSLFVDGYTGPRDRSLVTFHETPDYFEFDNNVFQTYGSTVPFRIGSTSVETLAELESSYPDCDNNLLIDHTYYTEMVDPTATEGGDYNIHYASRSFDHGLGVLNTYNVVTDINGDSRVLNADVDAGSDEVAAQTPVGACCYNSWAGRSCQIATLSRCESINGTYKGDWQECSPWPCSQSGGNGGGGGGGKVLPTQPGGGSGGGN